MAYTKKMQRMFGEEKKHGKIEPTRRWRRADYAFIADVLRHSRLEGHGLDADGAIRQREQWLIVVSAFERRFSALDPEFDAVRFLDACGTTV